MNLIRFKLTISLFIHQNYMKRKSYFFILLLIHSVYLLAQTSTKIKFDLTTPFDTIFYNDKKKDCKIILDKKVAYFKIKAPKYFGLTNNGYKVIYLEPGFDLKVKGDYINDSVRFEGKGAVENNYLTKKETIQKKFNRELDFFKLRFIEKDIFYNKLLKYQNLFLENLNNFKFDSNFFYDMEVSSIKFLIARRVKFYQGKKNKILKTDLEKYPHELLFPFENIDLDNEKALAINGFAYVEHIQYYLEKIMNKAFDKSKGLNYNQEIQLLASKKIKSQKILNDFLLNYTWGCIKYLPEKSLYFESFQKFCTNSKYKKIIEDLYLSYDSVKKGKQSPNFNLVDSNGVFYNINHFKGKPTYIDVWATWCKPCLADYPKIEKLYTKYGDKINFISINYLDTKDNWYTFLNKNKPQWKQLFAGNTNELFFKKYNITGVPRYILLDENSKIIFNSAPTPYGIEKFFNDLIE